jgi:cell division septum initiation protein DivIVA
MDEPKPDQDFDIVMRGYARDQVEQYVQRSEAVIGRLRKQVIDLERTVEWLRLRVDEQSNPSHGEAGSRVARMLRLAEDEANDLVRQAKVDAERARMVVEREIGQRRRNATIEAERIIEHAKETAEDLVQVAAADAENMRAGAEEQVERALTEVTEQREELARQREDLDARLARIRTVLAQTGWIDHDPGEAG